MLTLHIANKNYSSWSLRPWVLMRELGIPFEERVHPFGEHGGASGFESFSPSGKVPCLVDDEIVVWDSLAIAEYLAEGCPPVWPSEAKARAFARCAAAEMHSGFQTLRSTCGMTCGLRVKLQEVPPALTADLSRLDQLWSDGLSRFGGPFLAGEAFTAADAFFAPVAFRLQTYAPPVSALAETYARRLLALPSMQAWYHAALQETWRDEPHEEETRAVGTVVQDLRRAPV